MNILVVDDEIYIVRWIVESIKWLDLGIEKVFTAFSMGQAQKVFAAEKIDILLSDIEMPKGSGLDLLEWANHEGYYPVTLFLTSYAKFEYAQKAIQMQCLGYVVKPMDGANLTSELQRAVETKHKNDKQKQYQNLAEYWNSQLMKRTENFWHRLFSENIPAEEKIIAQAVQNEHLPVGSLSMEYFYILVQVEILKGSIVWGKELLNFAVRNILSEVLCHQELAPIPDMGEDHFMIAYGADQYDSEENLLIDCNNAARACERVLPGKFTLFLAGPGKIAEAAKYYKTLKKLESECFSTSSIGLSVTSLKKISGMSAPDLPIKSWTEALLIHQSQSIVDQLKRFFPDSHSVYLRTLLNELYYGILQAIYASFEMKGIPSNELFIDEECQPYIAEATKSAGGFFQWVGFILAKAENELNSFSVKGSVVESVRQYVLAHIDDYDLSRIRIASAIHLNPDYLSSVFKDKSGQSLSSFITSERIKAAKKLLVSTDLPITEVSGQTGFTDISYFSKQFKLLCGMTPQQYRKFVGNK